MAYQSEHGRYRNDPTDPFSRSGLRPHEFPERGETGLGGLAVAAVLIALLGLFILASAFGGGETEVDGGLVPAAEPAAPAATGN